MSFSSDLCKMCVAHLMGESEPRQARFKPVGMSLKTKLAVWSDIFPVGSLWRGSAILERSTEGTGVIIVNMMYLSMLRGRERSLAPITACTEMPSHHYGFHERMATNALREEFPTKGIMVEPSTS